MKFHVFVDHLQVYGKWRYGASCHLMPEDHSEEALNALHGFAAAIGMKFKWFQDKSHWPHYDLTQSRRLAAVKLGAIECSTSNYIRSFKLHGHACGVLLLPPGGGRLARRAGREARPTPGRQPEP